MLGRLSVSSKGPPRRAMYWTGVMTCGVEVYGNDNDKRHGISGNGKAPKAVLSASEFPARHVQRHVHFCHLLRKASLALVHNTKRINLVKHQSQTTVF
jgi:hypothetical protein